MPDAVRTWWTRLFGVRQEVRMPISRRLPSVPPEPHNPAIDEYEGMWVAVDDQGKVRAAAKSSRDLAWEIRQRKLGGKVTAQFVPPPTAGLRVGLG